MSKADALMTIPKKGQTVIQLPMEIHLAIKAHAAERGLSISAYTRQAVGMRLRQDGFTPEYLEVLDKLTPTTTSPGLPRPKRKHSSGCRN